MTVKITYFVHAATPESEQELSSGWSDPPLSSAGIGQATRLSDQIKPWKFQVVFSSDLQRAVQSARVVFEGFAPIVQDPRLRECNYGKYNAQPSATVDPLLATHVTEKFPGGESCEDVKARVADFLAFLKDKYSGKSVAIMSHRAPQLALDVLLKNKTWEQAFAEDWRKKGAWQPGWQYVLK